jgi:hypothetical protein
MSAKLSKNRPIAYKRQGVLVFRVGGSLAASVVDATIEKVRDERARMVLGRNWNLHTKAQ